jgi:hypothetical protein
MVHRTRRQRLSKRRQIVVRSSVASSRMRLVIGQDTPVPPEPGGNLTVQESAGFTPGKISV